MVDTLVSGTRIPKGCASSSLVPGKIRKKNKTPILDKRYKIGNKQKRDAQKVKTN